MTNVFRQRRAVIIAIIALALYLVGYVAFGSVPAKFAIDSVTIGVAAMVTWTWGSAAWRAFTNLATGGVSKIVLAVWMAWTALLVQRIYVVILVLMGRPDWLANSFIPGFISTLILIAGVYALLAPSADEAAPRAETLNLIIGAVVGAFVAGIAIGALVMRGIATF